MVLSYQDLEDSDPNVQYLDLQQGWSMFSTYMLADNMALESVLNPILDTVIIAKDFLGNAYLPGYFF